MRSTEAAGGRGGWILTDKPISHGLLREFQTKERGFHKQFQFQVFSIPVKVLHIILLLAKLNKAR